MLHMQCIPMPRATSGMTMTMGKGAIISMSRKQKLNTRSSTEAELVAVDDSMSAIPWVKNFLEEQDCRIEVRIILQDNESAIRLEINGQKSVGQRSSTHQQPVFFHNRPSGKRHFTMAEDNGELERMVELAAGIIVGSQNTVKIVKAMEIAGFSLEERRNMTVYQKVRRRSQKLCIVEKKRAVQWQPFLNVDVAVGTGTTTVSSLTSNSHRAGEVAPSVETLPQLTESPTPSSPLARRRLLDVLFYTQQQQRL